MVVHIGICEEGNGAARASRRLHSGLRREGVKSKMFVKYKKNDNKYIYSFNKPSGVFSRLKVRLSKEFIKYDYYSYIHKRPEDSESFHDDRVPYGRYVLDQIPNADVLNLHSVYGLLDHISFFSRVSVPVVWTIHDTFPFTGGCEYTLGCKRYLEACGRCPQLGSETEQDPSRRVWERKRRAYRPLIEENRLRVVAPSTWMAEEARSSSLFSEAPVDIIPNGLDPDVFRPRDIEGVASALGIPPEHRIVLFLASSTENPRKGFDLFAEAAEGIDQEEVSFVSVGGGQPDLAEHLHHVHLGHVESDLLLSVFYSLADLFVIPSRQDNLPNTVLESMACGTPVVGTDAGGIPDMVRPGETGWLAESGNVRDLREALETALRKEGKRNRRGTRCRQVVEEEYTIERQAKAYEELYRSLVGESETREESSGHRAKN